MTLLTDPRMGPTPQQRAGGPRSVSAERALGAPGLHWMSSPLPWPPRGHVHP